MTKAPETDYEQLRQILERELDRPVSIDEAIATGKTLVNIYEVLLYNRGDYDTIKVDTTYQTKPAIAS
jgi:hypothetical protein